LRCFNLLLQQESPIRGEELIKDWLRSDSRGPTDHRICLKSIFSHKLVLD